MKRIRERKKEHHQSTVIICVDFNQFVRSVWRRFGMYMCFAYTIMLIVSYKSWFRLVRVVFHHIVFHHIHMHMPLQSDTYTSSPTLCIQFKPNRSTYFRYILHVKLYGIFECILFIAFGGKIKKRTQVKKRYIKYTRETTINE